ncbi:MAG: TIGR04211 family SH3 domain-containing protein [Pseudomonadota bacterium]
MRKIWLFLLLPAAAGAETAYVTDVLRLNVYATPDFSGSVTRTLVSGDAFEVLVRDRLATQVQLADGTEGYVRSAYIVDEKPARLIVAETQAEVDRLDAELRRARETFADPAAEISSLEARIATLEETLSARDASVADLEEETAGLKASAARYANSVPLSWSLGALLVALVAGFIAGLKYVDHQIRKRHGGIRVL